MKVGIQQLPHICQKEKKKNPNKPFQIILFYDHKHRLSETCASIALRFKCVHRKKKILAVTATVSAGLKCGELCV